MMSKSSKNTKPWYGPLPEGWNEQRIKTLFDLRDERNYLPLSEVNLISLYTDIGVRQHSILNTLQAIRPEMQMVTKKFIRAISL